MRVVEADALALDWERPAGRRSPGPWSLVANLPYNVAVPLVIRVLEEAPSVSSLLVMVQREVGERLVAGPGEDAYGAVSVKVAYWAGASIVGRVPPSVFIPRPRVESVLVRLERRARLGDRGAAARSWLLRAYDRLFSVVRAGFAHRRKMLRRSLDGVVDRGAFEAAGIPSTARAEELSLEAWERLAAWEPLARARGRPEQLAPSLPRRDSQPGDESGQRRGGAGGGPGAGQAHHSLRVTGVRPDGYHLLESEMVTHRPGRHAGDAAG